MSMAETLLYNQGAGTQDQGWHQSLDRIFIAVGFYLGAMPYQKHIRRVTWGMKKTGTVTGTLGLEIWSATTPSVPGTARPSALLYTFPTTVDATTLTTSFQTISWKGNYVADPSYHWYFIVASASMATSGSNYFISYMGANYSGWDSTTRQTQGGNATQTTWVDLNPMIQEIKMYTYPARATMMNSRPAGM